MADKESVDKFNETLKRMLESPPKPHDDKKARQESIYKKAEESKN